MNTQHVDEAIPLRELLRHAGINDLVAADHLSGENDGYPDNQRQQHQKNQYRAGGIFIVFFQQAGSVSGLC